MHFKGALFVAFLAFFAATAVGFGYHRIDDDTLNTLAPTSRPTEDTPSPTARPTAKTAAPTVKDTASPTAKDTASPTAKEETDRPTDSPTSDPTEAEADTKAPTGAEADTKAPTGADADTKAPTRAQTKAPTNPLPTPCPELTVLENPEAAEITPCANLKLTCGGVGLCNDTEVSVPGTLELFCDTERVPELDGTEEGACEDATFAATAANVSCANRDACKGANITAAGPVRVASLWKGSLDDSEIRVDRGPLDVLCDDCDRAKMTLASGDANLVCENYATEDPEETRQACKELALDVLGGGLDGRCGRNDCERLAAGAAGPLTFGCEGDLSCLSASFAAGGSGAFGCEGDSSCVAASFAAGGSGAFGCEGEFSCASASFAAGGPGALTCDGFRACASASFVAEGPGGLRFACDGGSACESASFAAEGPGGLRFSCGVEACPRLDVTSGGPIHGVCAGQLSCQGPASFVADSAVELVFDSKTNGNLGGSSGADTTINATGAGNVTCVGTDACRNTLSPSTTDFPRFVMGRDGSASSMSCTGLRTCNKVRVETGGNLTLRCETVGELACAGATLKVAGALRLECPGIDDCNINAFSNADGSEAASCVCEGLGCSSFGCKRICGELSCP